MTRNANERDRSMTNADEQTQLCFLPATELAARIRRRDLSPVEVINAYLDRIGERNPVINAYTTVLADRALDAARAAERDVAAGRPLGPLHGVPVAIKDLDDVAGVPTSMGSLAVRDKIPARNAAAVDRLEQAGAIVLGKTNSPEFGHKGTTDNLRFGPTSTPWATGKNSGGSSGGSAAAVADGLAALGEGTDGGGSVRIPAAFCGVVGFKASFGRIPSVTRPDAFLWQHPYVHIGPLARTVTDAALMAEVMSGPHNRDPLSLPDDGAYLPALPGPISQLRVAYSPQLGNFPVDPAVATVVANAVDAISGHGTPVDLVELDFKVSHQELAAVWVRQISVHYAAIAEHLKRDGLDLLGDHADELTPEFRMMLESATRLGAVEHRLDDLLHTEVFDALEDVLERYDVIVCPTLAVPSVLNADDGNTVGPTQINGESVDPLIGWCMTYPVNYTGHPAISVPAGMTPDGMPIGLQIIGRRFADQTVLAVADAVERMLPWFDSYPGLANAVG
jgi:amidase/aspartyl-tRNA(Asn)/glutamyl-tRNA(Gln) amidotransferase subunit A